MYFSPSASPCGRFSNVESNLSMSPTCGAFLERELSIDWGETEEFNNPFKRFAPVQYEKDNFTSYHGEWWGENEATTFVTLAGPPPASLATDTFRSQTKRQGGTVVAGRVIKEEASPLIEPTTSPVASPLRESGVEMMSYSYDTYSESTQVHQPRRKKQKIEVTSPPPPPVRKAENTKRTGGRRSAEILPPVAPPLPIALQLSGPVPVFRIPKRKTMSNASVAIATSAPVSRLSCATSDLPGAIVSSSPPWAPVPTSPPRQVSTVTSSLRSAASASTSRTSDVQLTLSPRSFEYFSNQSQSYQKLWEEHMSAMEPLHEREAKSQHQHQHQHRATSPSHTIIMPQQ